MSSRFPIIRVDVADWADVGPLCEVRHPEDGEVSIVRPDSQIVVIVETERGEEFVQYDFPSWDAADERVRAVRAKGSINPDQWDFFRTCYGTQAYIDAEADIAAREKSDALIEEMAR